MNQKELVEPLFTIFHFNDVYDIQPNKVGAAGIVSFQCYLRKLREQHKKNILLFSGDSFSPSILTNIFEGKQMVFCLNQLKIDMACFGNHQFDFDHQTSQNLATSCNFPWLLGNIKYKSTQFNLGNGITYLTKQVAGLKLGIFGVAGQDWLGILGDEYEDQLEYFDVYQHSKKICSILRQKQKCDMVIALTHMRVPQDKRLPQQVPDIDIVLGGHDHIVMKQFINGMPVLKSGDNFKNIGVLQVYKKDSNPAAQYKCKNFDLDINIHYIPIMKEDISLKLKQYVDDCMRQYQKNDRIVGYTAVDLDIRFSQIRTRETNYANFVADLVRLFYDADCCVINSGAFRNDAIIKAGPLNYSMVANLINDLLVVKKVPGSILFQMLQYACSNLPNTFAGSFLVVSGIKFTYDYRKNPRVQEVWVAGKPLQPEKIYSVATKFYLSLGGDGFSMIKDCKFIVDQVSGIDTLRLLLRFFKDSDTTLEPTKPNINIKSLMQIQKKESLQTLPSPIQKKPSTDTHMPILQRKISVRQSRISGLVDSMVTGPDGNMYVCINPKIDGRIISLYP